MKELAKNQGIYDPFFNFSKLSRTWLYENWVVSTAMISVGL
jgi:hypothetical protein